MISLRGPPKSAWSYTDHMISAGVFNIFSLNVTLTTRSIKWLMSKNHWFRLYWRDKSKRLNSKRYRLRLVSQNTAFNSIRYKAILLEHEGDFREKIKIYHPIVDGIAVLWCFMKLCLQSKITLQHFFISRKIILFSLWFLPKTFFLVKKVLKIKFCTSLRA